jgi:hypothetical protein
MLSYQREALQRPLPKDRKSELCDQAGLAINPANVSTRRADITITFAILLFAFSVRLFYLVQIRSTPLFYSLEMLDKTTARKFIAPRRQGAK